MTGIHEQEVANKVEPVRLFSTPVKLTLPCIYLPLLVVKFPSSYKR
jgi:hypothetical protein